MSIQHHQHPSSPFGLQRYLSADNIVSFVLIAALLRLASALPQAGSSSQAVSTANDAETSFKTVFSPQDVPHATSPGELVTVNVTVPVNVTAELLDSILLNADDPALLTEDPIATLDFFSPADFLTVGLSIDDIPAASDDDSTLAPRDLAALFGSNARGPFANFLKVASRVFEEYHHLDLPRNRSP